MIKSMKTIPEANNIKLKIIFVSVDPERDTPETMKNYLTSYDKSFIGVTGLNKED